MPPRPVSPVSFETCLPPTLRLEAGDLLGSDDELEDAAREAKRQRIERLAESYLRGSPLFILSATLKGPFDDGWVNPWKKSRKRHIRALEKKERQSEQIEVKGTTTTLKSQEQEQEQEQEWSQKRRKHVDARSSTIEVANPVAQSTRVAVPRASTEGSGGAGKSSRSSRYQSPHVEYVQVPATSDGKSRRKSFPWAKETPLPVGKPGQDSLTKHQHGAWLKKDRKETDFRGLDPPISPTASVSVRHLARRSSPTKESLGETQRLIPRSVTPHRISASPAHSTSSPTASLQGPSRSEKASKDRTSRVLTPHKRRRSRGASPGPSSDNLPTDSSLHIASSSSQLQKFEYRLPKRQRSNQNLPGPSPNLTKAGSREIHSPQGAEVASKNNSEVPSPRTDDGRQGLSTVHPPKKTDDLCFKKSRTGSPLKASKSASYPDVETTSDKPPSGQGAPGNPALADYLTSLHTASVPKYSEENGDTIPDPQLSTQAALLLAQKSFQNDLESPEHQYHMKNPTSDRRTPQRAQQSSPRSNHITPFHRLNAPYHVESDNRPAGTMVNTQYLIDSVMPYAFSTAKKTGIHARDWPDDSPSKRSHPSSALPTPEKEPHQQDDEGETQLSALPFTLTGETPRTVQDGQGGMGGGDSFNLSQAIAEAGSWLQQSWDFSRDLKASNNDETATLSADVGRSALGLDAAN